MAYVNKDHLNVLEIVNQISQRVLHVAHRAAVLIQNAPLMQAKLLETSHGEVEPLAQPMQASVIHRTLIRWQV